MGAALTAAALGTRALAVSADLGGDGAVHHWDTVEHVTTAVLDRFLTSGVPVAGLNVPDVALSALRGVVAAPLAPLGAVEARVTGRGDDEVTVVEEPIPGARQPEGTDARMLADGWATLTALVPVAADSSVDPADLVPADP